MFSRHRRILLIIFSVVSRAQAAPTVLYAPSEVVEGRRFRLVLEVPAGESEPKLLFAQEALELFDQSRPAAGQTKRYYYFRALKPREETVIEYEAGAGRQLLCKMKIWSERDNMTVLRKQGDIQLPRRWPLGEPDFAEYKTGMTMRSAEEVERIRAEYRAGLKAGQEQSIYPPAEEIANRSDDDLYDWLPPADIPRGIFVGLESGCPVHGREIFKHGGHYPWKFDLLSKPWKAQCPVGGELYPSNDFAQGDMTGGPYPDDGYGQIHEGKINAFIAVYCSYRSHDAAQCMTTLADGYLKTGNPRYAYKAGILLARMAREWGYLAGQLHHRYMFHSEVIGGLSWYKSLPSEKDRLYGPRAPQRVYELNGVGMTNYRLNIAPSTPAWARAYDVLFEALSNDQTLADYLKSKGLPVRTPADVTRYIEDHFWRVLAQAIMDRCAASNAPEEQMAMQSVALCLNYPRCRELVAWNYFGDIGMQSFLVNGYYRDGSATESTGGYNGIHVAKLWPIEEMMDRLRALRPDIYTKEAFPPLADNPKYKSVFDIPVDIMSVDGMYPWIGDTGGVPDNKISGPVYYPNMHDARETYEYAWRTFKDPKYAQVLWQGKGYEPGPDSGITREEIEQAITRIGPEFRRESALFDGYRLALLRSETPPPSMADLAKEWEPRAVWMFYGDVPDHRRDESMSVGLFANHMSHIRHLGYPAGAKRDLWEGNWATTFNARIIKDYYHLLYKGSAIAFAQLDGVSLFAADGDAYTPPEPPDGFYKRYPDMLVRRTLSLVDLGPRDFYFVDIFRLKGGEEQYWSFHANPSRLTITGAGEFVKQAGGTAAGADVPYGSIEELPRPTNPPGTNPPGPYRSIGTLAHLYDVERARPGGPWQADWALQDTDDLHLRMNILTPREVEIITATGHHPMAPKEAAPYSVRFLLQHAKGPEPLAKQFVSVVHTYQGCSPITSVQCLADAPEQDFVACKVETDQRTDYILSDEAPADPSDPSISAAVRNVGDSIVFSGQYGLFREDQGRFSSVALIRGTQLLKNGIGIQAAAPAYFGTIIGLDRPARKIIITPVPTLPRAWLNKYIYIGDDIRRSAYRVTDCRKLDEQRCELTLNWPSLLLEGRITDFEDGKIHTNTSLPIIGWHFYSRYAHHARLTDVRQTHEFLLDHIKTIDWTSKLYGPLVIAAQDAGRADAETLERIFGKNGKFHIYDYGTGDRVTFPSATQLRVIGPDTYALHLDQDVTVSLPRPRAGGVSKVLCRVRGAAEWRELSYRLETGQILVSPPAALLEDTELELRIAP